MLTELTFLSSQEPSEVRSDRQGGPDHPEAEAGQDWRPGPHRPKVGK